MPNGSNHAEKAAVLPIEYAGTIGWPVLRASFAMPFLFFKTTTSSSAVQRKIPAMPSGTRPTQEPSSSAFVIDLAETSIKPYHVM